MEGEEPVTFLVDMGSQKSFIGKQTYDKHFGKTCLKKTHQVEWSWEERSPKISDVKIEYDLGQASKYFEVTRISANETIEIPPQRVKRINI